MTPTLLKTRLWLILPEALEAMAFTSEVAFGDFPIPPKRSCLLNVQNGVGTIDITGPLMRNADEWDKAMGATDMADIHEALDQAGARPDVRSVMLNIDSPGGTVMGTPEVADAVASLNQKKPVYAFSSGLMCSAAYWIASQARAIYATPSARVGSIGVVQTVIDQSARFGKAGINVEVFTVGKYKAMGHPAVPLNDEQRGYIKDNLIEIANDFHAAVLSSGRPIPAEAMEGQTFSGKQAQKMHLASMVRNRSEAFQRLSMYHSAVDIKTRAMKTVEQELATATADLTKLQADHKAQSELLTEESNKLSTANANVKKLTDEKVKLETDAATAKADLDTAKTKITELEARQKDFDKKVQIELARLAASTCTQTPAGVTGGANKEGKTMTRAEFDKSSHEVRNSFFRNGGKLTD